MISGYISMPISLVGVRPRTCTRFSKSRYCSFLCLYKFFTSETQYGTNSSFGLFVEDDDPHVFNSVPLSLSVLGSVLEFDGTAVLIEFNCCSSLDEGGKRFAKIG